VARGKKQSTNDKGLILLRDWIFIFFLYFAFDEFYDEALIKSLGIKPRRIYALKAMIEAVYSFRPNADFFYYYYLWDR
jgi:hypothetical protein